MPNARCPFRVLLYLPSVMPAVTVRFFYAFGPAWRRFQAVTTPRGRVQMQQLVRVVADDGVVRQEWRVLADTKALGDVRHVAKPGERWRAGTHVETGAPMALLSSEGTES